MAHFYRVEGQKEQTIGITNHTMEWNLQFQSHKTSSEKQTKHLFRIFFFSSAETRLGLTCVTHHPILLLSYTVTCTLFFLVLICYWSKNNPPRLERPVTIHNLTRQNLQKKKAISSLHTRSQLNMHVGCVYIYNHHTTTIFFHTIFGCQADFLFSPRGVRIWKKRYSSFRNRSYIFRRTMEKNEHAPEAPTLCINNCGFFGTPATMNMCSKCHKNIILNQNQAKLAASIISGGSTSTNSTTIPLHPQPPSEPPPPSPERCTACRKRVGLTGFSCRCGNVFCSVHRYSDKHECSIDYRAIGKDAIAKANPIVKAEKLDKI